MNSCSRQSNASLCHAVISQLGHFLFWSGRSAALPACPKKMEAEREKEEREAKEIDRGRDAFRGYSRSFSNSPPQSPCVESSSIQLRRARPRPRSASARPWQRHYPRRILTSARVERRSVPPPHTENCAPPLHLRSGATFPRTRSWS